MNSSQLYAGEYYAYHPYPPKGRIPIDAQKVRLRHTEQRKRSYDKNRHTVAAITIVETGKEFSVPARQLIMFWDEYEVEQQHMLDERAERERHHRRQILRREILSTLINWRLNERGVPFAVAVDFSETSAYVDLKALRDWLKITNEEIEAAIDRAMEDQDAEKKAQ